MSTYHNGKLFPENQISSDSLLANSNLKNLTFESFKKNYNFYVEEFHSTVFKNKHNRLHHIENANFHKLRYIRVIEFIAKNKFKKILDIGNDKPFFSWALRTIFNNIEIDTISFPIDESPYPYIYVDIENKEWNILKNNYECCLFLECLEHLWRDPAFVFYSMNKILVDKGICYLTTPNACELHALTSILWQSHPNQRGKIFSDLESGHPHLYTIQMVIDLFTDNGFSIIEKSTFSPYGYTDFTNSVAEFAKQVSPYFEFMGEAIEVIAIKKSTINKPHRPLSVYETGEKCIS